MGWKKVPKSKVLNLLSGDVPKVLLKDLFQDKVLLMNSDKTTKIVCVSQAVFKVFDQIKRKAVQPLFLGIGVADTQDFTRARLNVQFARKTSSQGPRVIVNKRAEQLFLYGRDVWSGSIIRVEGKPERRGLVYVFNEAGVFLGLAFAMADRLLGKKNKTILKNVIDIGHYLRVEKN